MFAIERFQLEDVEEGPAPPHQGQEDLQKANKKGDRGGGSSNRQQSQLLAEHLARVRARKEARLQEQQEGGKQQEGAADVIDKRDKKKRKREEGAAPERPTAEAAAEAVGEQDDGDEERRKRKKEKKERKKLQDNTARAHPPASASEEAPAAEPDPEMKRTSGLDTVRRLLSGHLMKGRAVPAAQQPPQQAPQRAVAPGPPSAEEEKPVKAAERKQEEQRKKEKEGERAVAAEDGALSVGAACTKWGLDARLAPALEAQVCGELAGRTYMRCSNLFICRRHVTCYAPSVAHSLFVCSVTRFVGVHHTVRASSASSPCSAASCPTSSPPPR